MLLRFVKLLSLREEYVRGGKPATEKAGFCNLLIKLCGVKPKLKTKAVQQHVLVLSRGTFIVHSYQGRKEGKKNRKTHWDAEK